jgi:hypothetical protein
MFFFALSRDFIIFLNYKRDLTFFLQAQLSNERLTFYVVDITSAPQHFIISTHKQLPIGRFTVE